MQRNNNSWVKVKDIISMFASFAAVVALGFTAAKFDRTNKLDQAQMISKLSDQVGAVYRSFDHKNIDAGLTLDALYLLFKYEELKVIKRAQFEHYSRIFSDLLKNNEKFKNRWSKDRDMYQADFQNYIDGLQENGEVM